MKEAIKLSVYTHNDGTHIIVRSWNEEKKCFEYHVEWIHGVLYMQKYDHGMSFVRLEFDGTKPIYVLEWKYLTALLSCPVIKKIDSIEVKYGKDAGNGIFRC